MAFIDHLYRSSYCIISVFRNFPTFSITDIAKRDLYTPIVSWNFELLPRVIIRSKSTLFWSSTFQWDLSVKLSNRRSKNITRKISNVVITVRHCRSFGFWLKLANNCEMLNTLPLSDTQNWHHWIAESSPSKAIYNRWLHIAEKFVLKRF